MTLDAVLELAENASTCSPLGPSRSSRRRQDAVARGRSVAVTHAGRRSRPILARPGLRELSTIPVLLDAFRRG